ncbi:MAG: hypothetical protein ACE5IR_18655 [bacterium]
MRKSPFNYLITLIIGAILWIGTGVALGNFLAENAILAVLTEDEFKMYYRIVLAVTAGLGVAIAFTWYLYGARDATALALQRARRVWLIIFVSELTAAIAAVVTLVILFMDEGLEIVSYLLFFLALAVHTFLFFWICSFYLSPRSVKYIPLFRR